jgi:hypothetical protein
LLGVAGDARGEVKVLTGEDFSEKAAYERKAKEGFYELSKKIKAVEVQVNIEKLRGVGKDEWGDARQKVESGLDELEKAAGKARSYLKSE